MLKENENKTEIEDTINGAKELTATELKQVSGGVSTDKEFTNPFKDIPRIPNAQLDSEIRGKG